MHIQGLIEKPVFSWKCVRTLGGKEKVAQNLQTSVHEPIKTRNQTDVIYEWILKKVNIV